MRAQREGERENEKESIASEKEGKELENKGTEAHAVQRDKGAKGRRQSRKAKQANKAYQAAKGREG